MLSNAIKYSPNGGPIKVRAACRNHEMVLSVADTGIGLTAEQQAKVVITSYSIHYTKLYDAAMIT